MKHSLDARGLLSYGFLVSLVLYKICKNKEKEIEIPGNHRDDRDTTSDYK